MTTKTMTEITSIMGIAMTTARIQSLRVFVLGVDEQSSPEQGAARIVMHSVNCASNMLH